MLIKNQRLDFIPFSSLDCSQYWRVKPLTHTVMNNIHKLYLQRCADLANLATSSVSPNPRVGAVLVYDNKVIGEGYFQQDGQSHAEVNCLNSVAEENRPFITKSTLYVSLEPCCFHGRTPACTNLIIKNKIPKVVIGQLDQTAEVSGQGLAILEKKGVETLAFPDFKPTERVALPRQVFAAQGRPYVLLKYARSADHYLAPPGEDNYWITGKMSRRLVHFWRSRTNAILVGAGTLLHDNPQLDTRLYPGVSPLVCIVDLGNKVTHSDFKIVSKKAEREFILIQTEGAQNINNFKQVFIPKELTNKLFTYDFRKPQVIRSRKHGSSKAEKKAAKSIIVMILAAIANEQINHITVEGGSWLLNLFLSAQLWDEARVFTGKDTFFSSGLPAPVVPGKPNDTITLENDLLQRWYR